MLSWLVSAAGAVLLAFTAYNVFAFVQQHFLRSRNSLRKYGAGRGAWAVVTGASGGIGKEFALELARRKFNIVLISRSKERMQPVADELKGKGAEVQLIEFDFGVPNAADYKRLIDQLKTLDIGLLVNNVGVNIPYPEFFLDHTQHDFESMLNTNIRSVHQMTHGLLPQLVARNGAGVITVSSQSARPVPAAMLSVYAGTKAYLLAFGESLATEYKRNNVDVVTIIPSMTVSNMTKRSRATLDCPLPSAVVRPTLDSLGSGQMILQPYWFHHVMDIGMSFIPRTMLGAKILSMHKVVRAKSMKKFGERNAK